MDIDFQQYSIMYKCRQIFPPRFSPDQLDEFSSEAGRKSAKSATERNGLRSEKRTKPMKRINETETWRTNHEHNRTWEVGRQKRSFEAALEGRN